MCAIDIAKTSVAQAKTARNCEESALERTSSPPKEIHVALKKTVTR